MTAKKKIGLALVFVALIAAACGLALSAVRLWKLREPMCAKITETHMKELMNELRLHEPEQPGGDSFRNTLAKDARLEVLKDGWGRQLVIERTVKDSRSHYTIISLGRDGRRGPCCTPRVYNWDDDAVLSGDAVSGDQWQQIWDSLSMRGDGRPE
jgi:hypothetical protein